MGADGLQFVDEVLFLLFFLLWVSGDVGGVADDDLGLDGASFHEGGAELFNIEVVVLVVLLGEEAGIEADVGC